MIKINLLPVRAARKRETIKQQLIVFVAVIVLAVVGLYFWHHIMSGRIEEKNKEINEIRAEIAQLDREIGDVDKYKGLETELTNKLETINNLLKNKTGPVRVMDQLSKIMPKKVWLVKWEEKGGTVNVEGEALSNKDLGDFMEALEKPIGEGSLEGAMATPPESVTPEKVAPPSSPQSPGSPQPGESIPTRGVAPAKRYFTTIQLKESELKEDKKFEQAFIKFSLSLKVTYQL